MPFLSCTVNVIIRLGLDIFQKPVFRLTGIAIFVWERLRENTFQEFMIIGETK